MDETEWLAEQFEQHRAHLRTVAYRMLGSASESDSAVEKALLQLSGGAQSSFVNLRAWLTTVVGGICLEKLQLRHAPAGSLHLVNDPGPHMPASVVPIVERGGREAEHEAPDSVSLALLVVLETLTPAERLALVLHDMFAVPYDEIAAIVGRTPAAAEELARCARRRVRGATSEQDAIEPFHPTDLRSRREPHA